MRLAPMSLRRRSLLQAGLGLATTIPWLGRAETLPADDAQALHLLNRLAFGPGPGDLGRLQQQGFDAWIDEQLHPERLPLPAGLAQQLDALPLARASQRDRVNAYREAAKEVKQDPENGKSERREMLKLEALQAGEARLWRALQSPRQLEEVMVDFWFNHFNIFQGKGLDRVLVDLYEREAIRPHVLGRFRDLLGATAHHPAMLFYLDNWMSVAPGFRPRHGGGQNAPSGLNENYARELMELHTLGVDGGYTQADVTELARMLTGWTFNLRSRGSNLFVFDAERHDQGDKNWLGQHVGNSGQSEGEWALDQLSRHPATARHVGYKLAQYFVADEPPPALVQRLAQSFQSSAGDIRSVLRTLFSSAEFRDPAQHGSKFKTPYRYVLSALRATGVPVRNVRPLLGALNQLGMPLYGCLTPDGYKNTEAAWLNPEAITRRVNFATALASGRVPLARPVDAPDEPQQARQHPEWNAPPPDAQALVATLGGSLSARTRATVDAAQPALQAALVLGSPDFMRH